MRMRRKDSPADLSNANLTSVSLIHKEREGTDRTGANHTGCRWHYQGDGELTKPVSLFHNNTSGSSSNACNNTHTTPHVKMHRIRVRVQYTSGPQPKNLFPLKSVSLWQNRHGIL